MIVHKVHDEILHDQQTFAKHQETVGTWHERLGTVIAAGSLLGGPIGSMLGGAIGGSIYMEGHTRRKQALEQIHEIPDETVIYANALVAKIWENAGLPKPKVIVTTAQSGNIHRNHFSNNGSGNVTLSMELLANHPKSEIEQILLDELDHFVGNKQLPKIVKEGIKVGIGTARGYLVWAPIFAASWGILHSFVIPAIAVTLGVTAGPVYLGLIGLAVATYVATTVIKHHMDNHVAKQQQLTDLNSKQLEHSHEGKGIDELGLAAKQISSAASPALQLTSICQSDISPRVGKASCQVPIIAKRLDVPVKKIQFGTPHPHIYVAKAQDGSAPRETHPVTPGSRTLSHRIKEAANPNYVPSHLIHINAMTTVHNLQHSSHMLLPKVTTSFLRFVPNFPLHSSSVRRDHASSLVTNPGIPKRSAVDLKRALLLNMQSVRSSSRQEMALQ